MTADIDPEEEYLSRGFAGCIRKPFRMNELLETVSRIVRGNRRTAWQPDFSLILTGEDNGGDARYLHPGKPQGP